jgi:hypothetical protein
MDIGKSAIGIEVLDLYPAAENCPHFLTIIADRTKGVAFRMANRYAVSILKE